MDYCANETLEHKEEEQHTKGSITVTKDAPSPKTIGEGHQEGKEEAEDCNITLPMPHHP